MTEAVEKCRICGCWADAPAPDWCPAIHKIDLEKKGRITEDVNLGNGTKIPAGTIVKIYSEGSTKSTLQWTDGERPRQTTINNKKIEKCTG